MHVGIARFTLFVPHARSLKDKRSVVRKFRDRVRARFPVSIAEVGGQDLLQRAEFGVAVVSGSRAVCERILGDVGRQAETCPDAVLTDSKREVIPVGRDLYASEQDFEEDADDDG